MDKVLLGHVIDKIWCSPSQDNQFILAAKRITRDGGDTVSTSVMTRRLQLPEPKKYYHVYSVGQVTPGLLGLLDRSNAWSMGTWVNLPDAMNNLPVFCEVYTDKGVRIPLDHIYYQYTIDRAFVFTVEIKHNRNLDIDYNNDQLYFRLYSNAYYDAAESDALQLNTRIFCKTIKNNADILEVQGIDTQWRSDYPGCVFSYVNGHLVHAIDMLTAKIGDYVETVLDASMKRVVDFSVSGLKVFTSLRDDKLKYLLHYPSAGSGFIDYLDDIDVYLISKSASGQYKGRLIHRNVKSSLRMVTHRDYSLSTEHVSDIQHKLEAWLTENNYAVNDFHVRLYIRNSGLFKTLPFESNRISELYKLPDDKVVNALIGANATVPFWTAQSLENSAFVKLLDCGFNEMTPALIEEGLGYNAISKVLADSPIYSDYNNTQAEIFTLPPGLSMNSTLYEYDSTGKLLGWKHHDLGVIHIPDNPQCKFIEGVIGLGSKQPSVVFGMDDIAINTAYDYRVYMAYGTSDVQTTPWRDITGSDMYTIENGRLRWLTADEDYILMVRSNDGFLAYDLDLIPIAGTLYFPLSEESGGLHRSMPVPMGELDIWLNGHLLIRGLDYVLDFPNVTIINKSYLIQPAGSMQQKVTVRFTDFAQADGDGYLLDPVNDYGFIEHGVLSNNNRYDIREDKVISISVRGLLQKASNVIFSEEHDGVSVVNALNGQPYQVKERFIPFLNSTQRKAEVLRVESAARDKAVSDYMSVFLPEPVRPAPSSIQQRHKLYSPFFSHLINDLASEMFDREKIKVKLTDQVVMEICKPYEFLLKADPLNEELGIDYRLVLIHPHQLESTILLDVESYAFMKHVTKLYGKNLISLSGHLNINVVE